MSTWDVFDWQKRFRAAPSVWAVVDRDGLIGNLYVSKEAAMEEVRFLKGRADVTEMHVHSLALARERWRPDHPVEATPHLPPGEAE
jgi:hypothetical protein